MVKRKFAFLAFVIAALLLSGCSNPSDAASYKNGKITIERVQESVSTILKEREKFDTSPEGALTGEALTLNQLEFHVFSALLTQAAKDRNIVATAAEVAESRAGVVKNVGSEDQLSVALVKAGIASIDLNQYLSLIVLQDKLRILLAPNATDDGQIIQALQKIMEQTVAKQELKVNPRYGVWNTTTNKIDPTDPTGGALPKSKNQ